MTNNARFNKQVKYLIKKCAVLQFSDKSTPKHNTFNSINNLNILFKYL